MPKLEAFYLRMIMIGTNGMNKNEEYIGHFNQQSDKYSLCRPDYPEALFDYLAQSVDSDAIVWDCGTGTGQAAKSLAERFRKVIATDINSAPLTHAVSMDNIEYHCCPAEHTPIESGTVNLITIAQALHWFDFTSFYEEVRRVSAPNGLIAAWCYSLGFFNNSSIDSVIKSLYYDILGTTYWPKERFYIDEEYKTIPFPFAKQTSPDLCIEKLFNFEQLLGYLSTWSAVKEYELQNKQNPLDLISTSLAAAWDDLNTQRTIYWPLHCLVGKVHSR